MKPCDSPVSTIGLLIYLSRSNAGISRHVDSKVVDIKRPIPTSYLLAFFVALLSVANALVGPAPAQAASFTVVATGLNNPRHLTFGPDGALYVAEAGVGGTDATFDAPEIGTSQGLGNTGSITRIKDGIQSRVVTGLPSLGLYPIGGVLPTQTGVTLASVGAHDVVFDGAGKAYVLYGFATTTNNRTQLRQGSGSSADLGQLTSYSIGATGWSADPFRVDLVSFEELDNPDNGDFLNNPFDLAFRDNKFYVVDPGGNTFYSIDRAGTINLETVFQTEIINGVPVERVPTGVTFGPDGTRYFSELAGDSAPPGSARIYRSRPDGSLEIMASGFTQIIGLDSDAAGNLYVLEYDTTPSPPLDFEPPESAFKGALTFLSSDGKERKILVAPGEGLVAPNGIKVGTDGGLYVSNYGITNGTGQVIRYDTARLVPEPGAIGALAISTLGLINRRRRAKALTP
jgi:hypothetical protein